MACHTEPNTKLSSVDEAFAASARMYPALGASHETESDGDGDRGHAGRASAQPGEEDRVHLPGTRARDGTRSRPAGPTDLVMKLFGPGSRTQLVAEDDDSGQGNNPQIMADLAPGRYFVQVRHYNEAQGTGSYTMKVYR